VRQQELLPRLGPRHVQRQVFQRRRRLAWAHAYRLAPSNRLGKARALVVTGR
jgi:hypothetical protein